MKNNHFVFKIVLNLLQLIIQHTEVAIKSIDLQLIRVETCGSTEGYSRDGKSHFPSHQSLIFNR